jgi:hypothetical protein
LYSGCCDMLSPFDYGLWCAGFLVEVYLVVWSIARRQFFRYLSLQAYVILLAITSLAQFFVLRDYGFSSHQYLYTYYYSDCLLTVALYLVVMGLYSHVFQELKASRYVRVATVMLLLGVAGFSYVVVRHNAHNLTGKFVLEISQNLYFVGAVLTYGLWVAVLKLRETRARLIQLVLALGVYFSAFAALYALRNLFPNFALLHGIPPLVGLWLPMAWTYALTRIPEEARLAPSAVAAEAR